MQLQKEPLSEAALQKIAANLDKIAIGPFDDPESERFIVAGEDSILCSLSDLLRTANAPLIPQLHRVKAYDVLFSFLENVVRNDPKALDKSLESPNLCHSLVDLYLARHDSLKVKHNKRLLNVLLFILHTLSEGSANSSVVDSVLSKLCNILFRKFDNICGRPALTLLAVLLTKRIIPGVSIIAFGNQKGYSNVSISGFERILDGIIYWTTRQETVQAASHLLINFLNAIEQSKTFCMHDGAPLWANVVLSNILEVETRISAWRNYVLPQLFRRNREEYWSFLNFLRDKRQDNIQTILFIALQIGVDTGLAEVVDTDKIVFQLSAGECSEVQTSMIIPSLPLTYAKSLVQIPVTEVERFMLARDTPDSRIAGLSLLVKSTKRTSPFLKSTQTCLRRHIPQLYADSDPALRGEILGITQELVERIRMILISLARTHTSSCQNFIQMRDLYNKGDLDLIGQHVQFIAWLHVFLVHELQPCSTYQQHITSLRALLVLTKSGIDRSIRLQDQPNRDVYERAWPVHLSVFSHKTLRLLSDLLLDPFDDVRQFSASLIQIVCRAENSLLNVPQNCDYHNTMIKPSAPYNFNSPSAMNNEHFYIDLDKAERRMLNSGRADHADGVARVYGLLICQQPRETKHAGHPAISVAASIIKKERVSISPLRVITTISDLLRHSLGIAESDVSTAVKSYPVHGYFLSLRYSLNALRSHYQDNFPDSEQLLGRLSELAQLVSNCWYCVKPVLCSDAPEGYVFDDYQEEANIGTKDILSWAWRAMKESSLLVPEILSLFQKVNLQITLGMTEIPDTIMHLCNLTFVQLAELRHRGAFSIVAQTFLSVCQFGTVCRDSRVRNLRKNWYHDVFSLIRSKGLSITRRSAGIPAILIGLLTSEEEEVASVIHELKGISLDSVDHNEITKTELPQVHAMNSLRTIFTTAKLSSRTEDQIVQTMDIASQCLSSEMQALISVLSKPTIANSDRWSIRNSALMLLRSLINRLLGAQGVEDEVNSYISLSSKLNYQHYPGLLMLMQTMLESIQEGSERIITEAIFPVLDLLRRAPPPSVERERFQKLVLKASSSSKWHVRTMAARAFASIAVGYASSDQVLESLLWTQDLSENVLHGRLLCVYHYYILVLRRQDYKRHSNMRNRSVTCSGTNTTTLPPWIFTAMRLSQPIFRTIFMQSSSAASIATCVDILNLLAEQVLQASTKFDGDLIIMNTTRLAIELFKEVKLLAQVWENKFVAGSHLLQRATLQSSVYNALLTCRVTNVRDTKDNDVDLVASTIRALNASKREIALGVIQKTSSLTLSTDLWLQIFLVDMLTKAFYQSNDTRLRSFIFETFVSASSDCEISIHLQRTLRVMAKDIPYDELLWTSSSPSTQESHLRIRGLTLAASLLEFNAAHIGLEPIKIWIRSVHACLNEGNDFPLRHAAMLSFKSFVDMLLCQKEGLKSQCLHQPDFIFVNYDALNDDDDEIRAIAAQSAMQLLRVLGCFPHITKPVPVIAQQMLAKVLLRFSFRLTSTSSEILSRLKGQDSISIEHQLAGILNESEALFVVEKQNLYVNPTREAWFWSRIMKHLDAHKLTKTSLQDFEQWALPGLESLQRETLNRQDGSFGWTSKPEVFALGMRVIYAVELLLHWRLHGVRVTKTNGPELRRRLQDWFEIGASRGLHPLWLEGIENVICKGVQVKVSKIGAVLNALPLSIC